MKKIILFLILIICIVGCLGCGKEPSISFKHESITINMDETFEILEIDITIKNSKEDYVFQITDSKLAKIEENKIIPLSEGETSLKISLENSKDCCVEVPLIITNNIYATSLQLEKTKVQINFEKNRLASNKLSVNEGCNEIPRVMYSVRNVTYNYMTGEIEALSVGTTTVSIVYSNRSISFIVEVVGKIFVQAVEIEDQAVYAGMNGKLKFGLFPENANMYEFSSESQLLEIDEEGNYCAISIGVAEVKLKYWKRQNSEPQIITFYIEILEEIEDFNVSILNINGNNCQYYMYNDTYIMKIFNLENLENLKLKFSDNIDVVDLVLLESSKQVKFKFKSSGDITFVIDVLLNEDKIASKDVKVKVFSKEDIRIGAKWFIYNQDPLNDGKYYIYPNSNTLPNYLDFSLKVGNFELQEDYKIYDVSNGTRIEINDSFAPTTLGEYKIDFVIDDVVVKSAIVVVSDYTGVQS